MLWLLACQMLFASNFWVTFKSVFLNYTIFNELMNYITRFISAGDEPAKFGKQRLWGAVGWGLMSVVSGYLIDLASVGQLEKDYTPSFYLVVIILSINVLSVIKIKVIRVAIIIGYIYNVF